MYLSAELPGWPLLSPLKIQMQKCDKCSREFCSPINYRRHIRVHRRSLNVDKVLFFLRDLTFGCWLHYVLKFCCMCFIYEINAPSFLILHVEIWLVIHCPMQLPFPCFCWTLLESISPSSLAEVIFILQESHKSRDLLGAFWEKVNVFLVVMSFPYKCGAKIFLVLYSYHWTKPRRSCHLRMWLWRYYHVPFSLSLSVSDCNPFWVTKVCPILQHAGNLSS